MTSLPQSNCPSCGKPLRTGRKEGLCSACLAKGWQQAKAESPLAEPAPELKSPFLFVIPGHDMFEEIARGGMGIVYRAQQRVPKRELAIKMLLPQLATDALRERFRNEARVMASLTHPGILPLYQYGEHSGVPWFSMALCKGTLGQRRASYYGQWQRIAELVAQLADAAAYAHNHGVLHRDIKPGNVLFDAQDRVFLGDFGLAKLVNEETHLTQSISVLGTPHYLAPEVIKSSANASIASDVYALGAILYELLAERPLFDGGSVTAILRQIAEDEPQALSSAVPRDLGTIALKCLSKSASHRYASALELADDLRRWLNHEPVRARRMSVPDRLVLWCKRKPALAAMSGLLLLCIAGGIALIVAKNRDLERSLAVSQQHRREALLATAVAVRKGASVLDRNRGLDAVREAALIQGGLDIEQEAASLLALPSITLTNDIVGFNEWFRLVPDRSLTLAADSTKTDFLRIVEMPGRKELARLPAGYPMMTNQRECFSLDGRLVYYRDFALNALVVRDWRTGRTLLQVPVKDRAFPTMTADGKRLAVGKANSGIEEYDLEHPELPPRLWMPQHLKRARPMSYSPDGKYLAAAGENDQLLVLESGSWKLLRGGRVEPSANVVRCTWFPDSNGVLIGTDRGTVRAWIIHAKDEYWRQVSQHFNSVQGLDVECKSQLAITSAQENVTNIIDWPSGRIIGRESGSSTLARFSEEGKRLVLESSTLRMRFYDVNVSTVAHQLVFPDALGHFEAKSSGMYAYTRPDGRIVASGRAGAVHLFDMSLHRELAKLPTKNDNCIAWVMGGGELWTAGSTGIDRWHVIDNSDGSITVKYAGLIPLNTKTPDPIAVADASDRWAMGASDGIFFGSIKNATLEFVPAPKTDREERKIYYTALSQDGRWLSGCDAKGGKCLVFDLSKKKCVKAIKIDILHFGIFANDSQDLWIGTWQNLRHFHGETWEEQPPFNDREWPFSRGFCASPADGRFVAMADGSDVLLRDGATGNLQLRLKHPLPIPIVWVNVTPDGRWLTASGVGDVVQMWHLPSLASEMKKLGLQWRGPEFPDLPAPKPVTKIIVEPPPSFDEKKSDKS